MINEQLKMMLTRKGQAFVLLGAMSLIAIGGQEARADIWTTSIGDPNTAISPYTGPYASVEVNLTSATTATITFTSETNGSYIYLMGGAGIVNVNVNATSFTAGTLVESNAGTGFTPGPQQSVGSGNVSDFGFFNLSYNNFDGYTHSADTVSFTLTNDSGSWANAQDVLTNNADGYLAAAHIFVTTIPADATNTAAATGYSADGMGGGGGGGGGGPLVPEPASIALLGLGGLLAGTGLRRRKKVTEELQA